jgi:hypothetical protein
MKPTKCGKECCVCNFFFVMRKFSLYPSRRCSSLIQSDRYLKPNVADFYSSKALDRHYFYVLDNRGQVFLEETWPRNIATSLKDSKFLDFTLKNMKSNDTSNYPEIPYISLCGKEINFISPMDKHSSLCFKDFSVSPPLLTYGGTLKQPFDFFLLAYCPTSGRLYHKVTNHRYLNDTFGLLHPHICQQLGEHVVENLSTETGVKRYELNFNGSTYPLDTI